MSILKTKTEHSTPEECKIFIRPVRDVIDIVGGKWKLPILTALSFKTHRFKELERQVAGITPRMLSKELKDLESNGLVNRKTLYTSPVTVEYSLTCYGKSLDEVLSAMREWGVNHRKKIMDK
ncbi:transcriptional regulator [Aquimarina sp. AD10]|uniref:winged helix-turn-helix transcriptional regulator n=1 Tax=Aquimarina sp. AD10 TaxID=1714849 RepID=UPI000E4EC08F|nr:helix-turn-helix domain-containing protein [Aquimarina sp. AD10]AXT61740.1 transcriptional regulator [Aquimarina sp. AD10]RKN00909.1 transcriptional regulator [Aquimarina sp. AD10]